MRARVVLALTLALAVIVAGIVGLGSATRAPVSGRVQLDTAAAGPAQVDGSWTTQPEQTLPLPKVTSPKVTVPKIGPKVTAPMAAEPTVTGPKHPTSFVVADATVAEVPLFSSPGTPLADRSPLTNPTRENLPLLFLLKERHDEWLKVLVSARPNGMEAWVRAADVQLRRVPNWIRVELGTRKVTVFHGDTGVFETTGAVGRASAPTPTGLFFVDGVVRLADPTGPYGIGQMSVSGFSDVYQRFGRGIGQIALHGTNADGLLGQAVSHGCVRLANDALQRVMELSPSGTPVEIVA